ARPENVSACTGNEKGSRGDGNAVIVAHIDASDEKTVHTPPPPSRQRPFAPGLPADLIRGPRTAGTEAAGALWQAPGSRPGGSAGGGKGMGANNEGQKKTSPFCRGRSVGAAAIARHSSVALMA